MKITHQKTYAGFSVARFNLHSNRRVDPSSMWRSGAPTISAVASVFRQKRIFCFSSIAKCFDGLRKAYLASDLCRSHHFVHISGPCARIQLHSDLFTVYFQSKWWCDLMHLTYERRSRKAVMWITEFTFRKTEIKAKHRLRIKRWTTETIHNSVARVAKGSEICGCFFSPIYYLRKFGMRYQYLEQHIGRRLLCVTAASAHNS